MYGINMLSIWNAMYFMRYYIKNDDVFEYNVRMKIQVDYHDSLYRVYICVFKSKYIDRDLQISYSFFLIINDVNSSYLNEQSIKCLTEFYELLLR